MNAISGGFGGNAFANAAYQRLRREARSESGPDFIPETPRTSSRTRPDVSDDEIEEDGVVDVQR